MTLYPAGFLLNPALNSSSVGLPDPTFKEQAEAMLIELAMRKRKPVHASTLVTWRSHLAYRLYPAIGHLPLSQITHTVIKRLIADMIAAGLKPTSINSHFQLVKRVIDSCLDATGESIYSRAWNLDILDMPVIISRLLNRPCFDDEVMTALARYRFPRERMVFILAAASGLRIGELLGLDIEQHISDGCATLRIDRQVACRKLVPYTKTAASYREVDIHSDVAAVLKRFIGNRTGLLFGTANGTPMQVAKISLHLHTALHDLSYVNPITGRDMAGLHAFRRFRNTHLGKCPNLPPRLQKYWMGHSAGSMSDRYDKSIEDREFRTMWAQRCGIGFELPLD
jgi:integrase